MKVCEDFTKETTVGAIGKEGYKVQVILNDGVAYFFRRVEGGWLYITHNFNDATEYCSEVAAKASADYLSSLKDKDFYVACHGGDWGDRQVKLVAAIVVMYEN